SRSIVRNRLEGRGARAEGRAANPLQAVRPADDVEHDLVGAGADPVQAHVAVGAFNLVLLHVAVATEDLHAFVGDLAAGARGEELRLGDLADRVLAVGEAPGCRVRELLRGLDVGRHVGELVANSLKAPDRAPKRLALLCVLDRALEHPLAARVAPRGRDEALALELPADVVEALAD